jgi:hypothetical protein
MKLAAGPSEALTRGIEELLEAGEPIAIAEDPMREEFLWHIDDLPGTGPAESVVLLVEDSNLIFLDAYSSLVQDAASSRRHVVIRFVSRDG